MEEFQTLIDECCDGTWDGTVLSGSTVVAHYNGPTFAAAALQINEFIMQYRVQPSIVVLPRA